MPIGKQPRSFVADIVDFQNSIGRQLILEAEVPVLDIGEAAGIPRRIRNAQSVRKRWIFVRQNRHKVRIAVLQINDRLFGKAELGVAGTSRDGSVESERTAESK